LKVIFTMVYSYESILRHAIPLGTIVNAGTTKTFGASFAPHTASCLHLLWSGTAVLHSIVYCHNYSTVTDLFRRWNWLISGISTILPR